MQPWHFINILSREGNWFLLAGQTFWTEPLNKETFPFWSNWASKIVLRAVQFAWHPALDENPAILVSNADHPHFDRKLNPRYVIFGNESGINVQLGPLEKTLGTSSLSNLLPFLMIPICSLYRKKNDKKCQKPVSSNCLSGNYLHNSLKKIKVCYSKNRHMNIEI